MKRFVLIILKQDNGNQAELVQLHLFVNEAYS